MKKVCYIVSKVNKAIAFEWIADRIDHEKIQISFILLNDKKGEIFDELVKLDIPTYFVYLNSKQNYLRAGWNLLRILIKLKPDVVHTHLRDADLLGLTVATILGIKNRITTRHSSTFNHLWYPKAVKWDKYINKRATNIIAISEVVKDVLISKENVPESKIITIHHGFDLNAFENMDSNRIALLKAKYQIPENKKIIGVVSRYIEWKGVQYIIEAYKELLETKADFFLILANAKGPMSSDIKNLLSELNTSTYCEIEFEPDLFALFHCFDYYIHVPIDREVEAFGQTYVEALASGIPSVFTLSGIANEFIRDRENSIVVPYKNAESIKNAILELNVNTELRIKISENGRNDIQQFTLDDFIHKLETLYCSL